MENYYAPDSRWDRYQVENKEEFVERLVINGYFHDQVPKDVVEAYKTIEYLMAHSYYHWPMYDEAFHKVLLAIEMGIKLKARNSGISIYHKQKNGKQRAVKLYNLINKVCDKDYLSDLKQRLHRSRNLRNMQVHPKQHSFSGAMGGIVRNIKYCVIVLNRLFRSKKWHQKQQNKIANIQDKLSTFQDKLMIVERGREKEVISSVLDFDIINNMLFIIGLPILDVKKLKADNKEGVLPDPIAFTFGNYNFYENRIVGETFGEDRIKLFITEREDLADAFEKYKKYLQRRPSQDKKMFMDFTVMEVPWHLSNLEYQYLSKFQKIN